MDLSNCAIIPKDVYLFQARQYMEEKYNEKFYTPYMYDEDKVGISPVNQRDIEIVVRYADWDGDGDDEWRDNYMMYKYKPTIYEDMYVILDEIYDEYKFYIDIIDMPIPNVVTKEEVYKMGVDIYIYTTKDTNRKDDDISKLIEKINEIGLYTYISVNYMDEDKFQSASEATSGRINQYKLYNTKKEVFMFEDIKEYDWEYGNVE